jgi:hypothetical protein
MELFFFFFQIIPRIFTIANMVVNKEYFHMHIYAENVFLIF